ncbi:MAG: hypothetical protein PF904_05860 [Kiritimatiellae bacterium]|nr:hypothetical protein [Kiritimatiellia bacterium]
MQTKAAAPQPNTFLTGLTGLKVDILTAFSPRISLAVRIFLTLIAKNANRRVANILSENS